MAKLRCYWSCTTNIQLDGAKEKFQLKFGVSISAYHICKILHNNDMSWKTLEVRAMQTKSKNRKILLLLRIRRNWLGVQQSRFHGWGIHGRQRNSTMQAVWYIVGDKLLSSHPTSTHFVFMLFGQGGHFGYLQNGWNIYTPSVDTRRSPNSLPPKSIIRYLRSVGIVPIFLPPYRLKLYLEWWKFIWRDDVMVIRATWKWKSMKSLRKWMHNNVENLIRW